jgi:uncharacterized protein YcfJ
LVGVDLIEWLRLTTYAADVAYSHAYGSRRRCVMDKNWNPKPDSNDAHPVATGVGAAGGAVTGAVIGTAVGGPVGTVAGGTAGAATGAIAGQKVAEKINPK